jgi:putative oligomerization/nucleic acid binding protein
VETGPLTHSEEEDMSFRDRARQRLQNRAQPAQPEDDQEPQNGPPEDGQEQPSGQPEQQQDSSAPAQSDYAAELEQLAQLKEQGILTEEEFTAKKKQILGI